MSAEIIWMKSRLLGEIEELREKRRKAWQEFEIYILEHPPKHSCDRGCEEAARIAAEIRTLARVGILLGLLAKDTDPMDYIVK